MTKLRNRAGIAVLRPSRGDVVLGHRQAPLAATVLQDPTGVVAAAIRRSATLNKLRNEEKR